MDPQKAGQLAPNTVKAISSTGKKQGGGGKTFRLKAEDMKLREFLLDGFIFCMKGLSSAKSKRKGSQGEGLRRKEMM